MRNRFPQRSDLLSVFGVAVFVCYTWTLFGFFNKLSSFLLYFTLAEIGNILAIMLAFALLESLAVTLILTLASAVLPESWLKDGFPFKSFIILVIATTASILFQRFILKYEFPSLPRLAASIVLPIALSVGLILLIHSRPRLQRILNSIQDRIQIMLFVYVPVGVFALLIVLYQYLL